MKTTRQAVADIEVTRIVMLLATAIEHRVAKHGAGAFASAHETLGIVAEEYHELIDACRKNDLDEIDAELMDIAVACIFGIASHDKVYRNGRPA